MKYNKILIGIMISICLICFLTNIVNAAGTKEDTSLSDVISGGDSFVSDGSSGDVKLDEALLKSVSSSVYNILLTIAIVIAIIVSAMLGIGFMIGSADEKAEIKDKLVPFIVGCIVIFGAFGIWKLAVTIGNELF